MKYALVAPVNFPLPVVRCVLKSATPRVLGAYSGPSTLSEIIKVFVIVTRPHSVHLSSAAGGSVGEAPSRFRRLSWRRWRMRKDGRRVEARSQLCLFDAPLATTDGCGNFPFDASGALSR